MDHKVYLSDPGIYRNGSKFYYRKNSQEVTDSKILSRIKSFVVPPAWKDVWYASKPRCHIQVYGIDGGGKKQYILSERWVKNAKYNKYLRMKTFIRDVVSFKRKIRLTSLNLTKQNITHLLFNLLMELHIRVGNEIYVPKSYGLTTLRQKHLKIKNGNFILKFVGKSNISHVVDIPPEYNQWFNILKLENSADKPLLWYRENGNILNVSSEELNEYLKKHMGKEYTCKDFRTYSANMLFIKTFLKKAKNGLKPRKVVFESIDESAKQLGHTRSISRKSYISESLVDYCVDSFSQACELSPSELLSKVWS